MKRILCIIAILLITIPSFADSVLEKVEKATVQIYLDCVLITPEGLAQTRYSGSGFLINEDGYILTNAHVITHNNIVGEIKVLVENEKTYNAKVIGINNDYDIALIKITTENKFQYFLDLASDTEIKDNNESYFMGYPLLQDFQRQNIFSRASISRGLIRLKKQQSYISNKTMDIIEISCDANHGNSGGPLFIPNSGKVIGIVTKRLSEQNTGISFAVPVNYVESLCYDLFRSTVSHVSETKRALQQGNEENKKIKEMISTIIFELESNISKLKRNNDIFNENVKVLPTGKMLEGIPLSLNEDAWKKIKIENVETFNIINEDVKKSIKGSYYYIDIYNGYIEKRKQDLSSLNRALGNYCELLLQNEKSLLNYGTPLFNALEITVNELKKYKENL